MVFVENIQDFSDYIHKNFKKIQKSKAMLFYFEFAFLVMQNPFFSVTLEFLSGVCRMVQFLSITLNMNFANCWTNNTFFVVVTGFLDYMNIVPLLKGSDTIYLIVFYFCIFSIIVILCGWIWLIKYSVTSQTTNGLAFRVFKFLLVVLSSCFYAPIIKVLLGLLWKVDGKYVFYSNKPLSDPFRYGNVILGGFFCLLMIIFSFATQSVLFEIRYSKERKYAKTSCKCDLEIILGQSILVIITIVIDEQWVKIIIAVIMSLIIFIDYVNLDPYYNNFLKKTYMIFLAVFAWSSIVLLLAKLIHNFTGSIYLFFIGIPIIVMACSSTHDDSVHLIMKTISRCETQVQSLKHIEYLLDIIQSKENGRRSKIIIDGYIRIFEENCHIANCTLYKYLHSTEKKQYKTLLYQHIIELYKIAIKRFPEFVKLRISYANFLNDVMKKKTESLIILDHNLLVTPSIEDQFLIYRIKREITEDTYLNAGSNQTLKSDSAANVSMANLNYKNKFMEFRQQMMEVSGFYVDFWNLLMLEGNEAEKLLKLNNIGTKITEKVEECDELFQKLHKMNPIDYLVLFYYSEFLRKVTNKVELADKYKNLYEKILQDIHFEEKEDGLFSSINNSSTNQSDEYQFILATAQEENFGLIKNISLGMCINLGYTREELIGKHINLIIPEIFRKSHDDILKYRYSQFKDLELSETDKVKDTSNFKLLNTFAIGKSKYLIDFNTRVGIIHTESVGDMFIARSIKILKENLQDSSNNVCHILTNINFGIQTFTPSANGLMQFNSTIMNKNLDITKIIKEFSEKFLEKMMEKDKKEKFSITKLKREIAEEYFSHSSFVTIRSIENQNVEQTIDPETGKKSLQSGRINKNILCSSAMGESRMKFSSLNQFKVEGNELMMEINKVVFGTVHKGYILKFEKPETIGQKSEKTNQKDEFQSASQKREDKKEEMDNILKNIDELVENNKGTRFIIDPDKLGYVTKEKETIGQTRDKLKDIAMNRIKQNETPTTPESTEKQEKSTSSSAESESGTNNEESYSDSEENQDDSEKDLSELSKTENEEEEKSPKNQTNQKRKSDSNSYYQVNFNCIKLLVYNYKTKRCQEQNFEKVSKVEIVTREGKETENQQKEGEGGTTQSQDATQGDKPIQTSEFGSIQNEISKSTSHQILENTLSKKETQPSLIKLKICSASSFVLVTGFIVVWFCLINFSFSDLSKNFQLIEKGYRLTSSSLNAMNYVRYLTLLQNENFTNYVGTKQEKLAEVLEKLKELYEIQHTVMKDIITSSLKLTKKNEEIFNSEVVNLSIIDPDTFLKNTFEANLQSAITEGYTSLRHIFADKKSLDEFIPTNSDIYFFLQNCISGIYKAEERQIVVYSEELFHKISSNHNEMLLFLVLIIPVLITCFFFIVCYFRRSTKRKEEYLIIFFDIGINVIKSMLGNCENFNNKIQSESVVDFFNEDENLENELDLNMIQVKENVKRANKMKKNHLEHIDASAQENLHLEILLCLFFVFVFILNFLVFYFSDKSMKTYKDYLSLFRNQMDNNDEYRKIYINTKEYAFGTNNYIGFEGDTQSLNEYFKMFQKKIVQKENNVLENQRLSKSFQNKIFGYYQTSLCNFNFTNQSDCESLKEMGVEYGLDVLLSGYYFFIREIKTKMDYVYFFAEKQGFKYNLTLTGTAEQDRLVPQGEEVKYFSSHPINLFNKKELAFIENGFEWIINPCFESIFEEFVSEITDYYRNIRIIFNIVLACFITVILISYFCVWVRFEQKLNNTIYKTKNMLSIIPVNILCNIPTVFQVLEIKSMTKGDDGKRIQTDESLPLIPPIIASAANGVNPTTTKDAEQHK